MSRKVVCIECGTWDGFHYSDCSMWNIRPKRKRRFGEKVGDVIEEIIDTLVDYATDLFGR